VWKVPELASGPGQIRFAEDILGDFRGRGRKEKKGKRRPQGGNWRPPKSGPAGRSVRTDAGKTP
jgi:hypothetical protein